MYSTRSMEGGSWGGGGSSKPPTPPRPPRQSLPQPMPEPPKRPETSQDVLMPTHNAPNGIVIAIGAEALQLGKVIEIRIVEPNM